MDSTQRHSLDGGPKMGRLHSALWFAIGLTFVSPGWYVGSIGVGVAPMQTSVGPPNFYNTLQELHHQ